MVSFSFFCYWAPLANLIYCSLRLISRDIIVQNIII